MRVGAMCVVRGSASRWARAVDDDIDRFARRIEEDLDLTAVELAHDLTDLDLQRNVALAVLGTLSQHEGLDDAPAKARRD